MKIHVLEDNLINKIAAGEVIERPASVVKELIENSIDAGATKIEVKISGGGLTRIEVEDNGYGLAFEDVPMCLLRHATSKIKHENDLFAISSMGFRGEALPSIASVSRMSIYSRTKGDEGVYACIEGGRIVSRQVQASPLGTRVVVEDLFYNTPARRKFMKSPVTEGMHINDMVTRYALARTDISFSLQSDSKNYFKTPGKGDLRTTLISLYGSDFTRYLLDVEYNGRQISLSGLISSPQIKKINRKNQLFFINQRPVRSPMLYRAIDMAYKGLLVSREHPVCILAITVPPDSIDVNVHPQKMEIRFKDESVVFRVVCDVLRRVLSGTEHLLDSAGFSSVAYEHKDSGRAEYIRVEEPAIPGLHVPDTVNNRENRVNADFTPINAGDRRCESQMFTIIGQYRNAYIILEKDDSLWIVDQHAAHERIIYSQLVEMYKQADNCSQVLAFPQTIELGTRDMQLLQENRDVLEQLGFVLEAIGYNSILLRAVPPIAKGREMETIHDFVDLLGDGSRLDLRQEAMIMMACKKAVKAGTVLNPPEMGKIIAGLFESPDYRHCPHGRPTLLQLSASELAKMFKR